MVPGINEVPIELLEEIFLLCVEPPTSAGIARRASSSSAPLLFMAVSKRWGQIAAGLPTLWDKLTIHNSQEIGEKICAGPNDWIARAKSRPLSISITINGAKDDLLQQFLLPNLSKVQLLSLSMPLEFYSVFAQIPQGSAPLLEEIRFTTTTFDPRNISKTPYIDVGSFFAIQSITLHTRLKFAGLMKRHAAFNIPWSTLTVIDIREPGLHEMELQELILQCTRVSSCTIMLTRLTTSQNRWVVPDTLTSLLFLEELRIAYNDSYLMSDRSDRLEEFLKPFIFPRLKTLEIRSAHGGTIRNMSAISLVHLQTRSSFDLKNLSLFDFHFDITTLTCFLQSVPTITTLHLETMILRDDLYRGCLFDELFQLITYQELTPFCGDILPQLQNLSVIYQLSTYYWRSMRNAKGILTLNQDELLDVVESRFLNDNACEMKGLLPLEMAQVVWRNLHKGQACFSNKTYSRIKELQDAGFHFNFKAQFHDGGFEEPGLIDGY